MTDGWGCVTLFRHSRLLSEPCRGRPREGRVWGRLVKRPSPGSLPLNVLVGAGMAGLEVARPISPCSSFLRKQEPRKLYVFGYGYLHIVRPDRHTPRCAPVCFHALTVSRRASAEDPASLPANDRNREAARAACRALASDPFSGTGRVVVDAVNVEEAAHDGPLDREVHVLRDVADQ